MRAGSPQCDAAAALRVFAGDLARAASLPGAGPILAEAGDTAVLMLHGWGASAESLRVLAAGVAGAGHSVFAPTLPGHGTSPGDMARTGPVDWFACARRALTLLSDRFGRVHVVGVSMGGALAIQAAAAEPGRIAGLVLVNAPLFFDQPRFALDLISGPPDGLMPKWQGPAYVGPAVDEISYPERSRKSGLDLLTVAAIARELLPLVEAPLLVVQSVRDPVVPMANAEAILARAGGASKAVAWLRRSLHMSQLDLDCGEVVRLILASVAGMPAAPAAPVPSGRERGHHWEGQVT